MMPTDVVQGDKEMTLQRKTDEDLLTALGEFS